MIEIIFLKNPWIGLLGVVMLFFFAVDFFSFWCKKCRHRDYKEIITGIGMLGTFSGIFIGLLGFDSSSEEAIGKSVPILLGGLQYAFATSIGGLSLALFLHLVQSLSRQDHKVKTEKDWLQQIAQQTKTLPHSAEYNEPLQHIAKLLQQQQEALAQLREDIYQQRRRFIKLDAQGEALAEQSLHWAAIRDSETGLSWEYKTPEAKDRHSRSQRFAWDQVGPFVQQSNEELLAGFADWRLPTLAEMQAILSLPAGPNQQFFGVMDDPLQPHPLLFLYDGQAILRDTGTVTATKFARVVLVRGNENKNKVMIQ